MKLTQEQKNVKIAEACGFKFTHQGNPAKTGYWYNPDHARCQDGAVIWDAAELPDYCGDLNAMHEAEKVFTNAQWQAFLNRLEAVTEAKEHGTWWECIQCAVHATAAQRAEAFGLTLGLWEAGQ